MVLLRYCWYLSKGRPRETRADKLRSIIAQMLYTYMIQNWDQQGVPFCKHLYVPDIHPITQAQFHEREPCVQGIFECVRVSCVLVCYLLFSALETIQEWVILKTPAAKVLRGSSRPSIWSNILSIDWGEEAISWRCRTTA